MTESKKARTIKANKELQMKVGTGQVDERVVDAAQKVIEENTVDFAPVAKPELDALQKALDEARKDMSDGDAVLESLKTPIMNLKANAATFKYKFISDLTGTVLMFLENVSKPDKKILQIVDVLHKTILLSLAYNMQGDGGAHGKVLLEAFSKLCQKYKPVN